MLHSSLLAPGGACRGMLSLCVRHLWPASNSGRSAPHTVLGPLPVPLVRRASGCEQHGTRHGHRAVHPGTQILHLLAHFMLGVRRSIRAYAAYLDTLETLEDEHPACTVNRLLLEHTWQVVANEFFDASGRFSQARPRLPCWCCHIVATL